MWGAASLICQQAELQQSSVTAKVREAVVTEDQPNLFPGPDLTARAELEVSK